MVIQTIAAKEFIKQETHEETFMEGSPIDVLVKKLRDEDVEDIRAAGTSSEFKLLCEVALEPMISREKWKMNHLDVNISALLTVSDEAFALLTIENNIDEWLMGLKYSKEEFNSKGQHTKYTGLGTNKDGTKKGWTLEGKMRFNDIYDAVVLQRSSARSKEMEAKVREEWKEQRDENDGKRRNKNRGEDEDGEESRNKGEEAFVPRNGFAN